MQAISQRVVHFVRRAGRRAGVNKKRQLPRLTGAARRGGEAVPVLYLEQVAHQRLGAPACRPAIDQRARWLELVASLRGAGGPPVDHLTTVQALRALAEATVRARANDLACFTAFCAQTGSPGLPSTPQTIVDYADHLATVGQKVTTIRRKLSSIAAAHDLLGLDSPTRSVAVHHALRAIGKERGTARRQALAVRLGQPLGTKPAPQTTLYALLDGCAADPRGLRDAALLSVAYDGGLRASEVINICVEDVQAGEDGAGSLHLRRSKTDQTGEGALVYLSPDTMRRIGSWLEASRLQTGPLFRRIARRIQKVKAGRPAWKTARALGAGSVEISVLPAEPEVRATRYLIASHDERNDGRLTRQGLSSIFRAAARRAADRGAVALSGDKLEEAIAAFSTHGFRVGLTHDLFAERFDVGQVQLALRWQSPATALGYARELRVQHNAAAQFLSRRRQVRAG